MCTCHGNITLNPRDKLQMSLKRGGGIHKHHPSEQSSCDIHNRMGPLLALKNNHALPTA